MGNAVDLDRCKAAGTADRKATIRYCVVGALVRDTVHTERIEVACYENKATVAGIVALNYNTNRVCTWNDNTDIELSFESATLGLRAFLVKE